MIFPERITYPSNAFNILYCDNLQYTSNAFIFPASSQLKNNQQFVFSASVRVTSTAVKNDLQFVYKDANGNEKKVSFGSGLLYVDVNDVGCKINLSKDIVTGIGDVVSITIEIENRTPAQIKNAVITPFPPNNFDVIDCPSGVTVENNFLKIEDIPPNDSKKIDILLRVVNDFSMISYQPKLKFKFAPFAKKESVPLQKITFYLEIPEDEFKKLQKQVISSSHYSKVHLIIKTRPIKNFLEVITEINNNLGPIIKIPNAKLSLSPQSIITKLDNFLQASSQTTSRWIPASIMKSFGLEIMKSLDLDLPSIFSVLRGDIEAITIMSEHNIIPWEIFHDGYDLLCLRYMMGRIMPSVANENARKDRYEIEGSLKIAVLISYIHSGMAVKKDGYTLYIKEFPSLRLLWASTCNELDYLLDLANNRINADISILEIYPNSYRLRVFKNGTLQEDSSSKFKDYSKMSKEDCEETARTFKEDIVLRFLKSEPYDIIHIIGDFGSRDTGLLITPYSDDNDPGYTQLIPDDFEEISETQKDVFLMFLNFCEAALDITTLIKGKSYVHAIQKFSRNLIGPFVTIPTVLADAFTKAFYENLFNSKKAGKNFIKDGKTIEIGKALLLAKQELCNKKLADFVDQTILEKLSDRQKQLTLFNWASYILFGNLRSYIVKT